MFHGSSVWDVLTALLVVFNALAVPYLRSRIGKAHKTATSAKAQAAVAERKVGELEDALNENGPTSHLA